MSESINYPSWQDVGVPVFFVDYLRRMGQGGTLDYLILNRVFRFNVRAQYVYECKNCGHTKSLHRHFEDSSTCEKCGEQIEEEILNIDPESRFCKKDKRGK